MLGQRLHVPEKTERPSIIPMLSLHAPLAVLAVDITNGQKLIVLSYDKVSILMLVICQLPADTVWHVNQTTQKKRWSWTICSRMMLRSELSIVNSIDAVVVVDEEASH